MNTHRARRAKILLVAGARPNFIKISPILRAFEARRFALEPVLVHTGQHHTDAMSGVFFRELDIPKPDIQLTPNKNGNSPPSQIAAIMAAFEPVVLSQRPDWVMVVGDVNSTVACALTANKLGVKVAHVEAGLRSFDRSMPEEINRICTDVASDILFCSETSGINNLHKERIAGWGRKAFEVGSVTADAVSQHLPKAVRMRTATAFGLNPKSYALATFHRPAVVDTCAGLKNMIALVKSMGHFCPVIFPMHPRTRINLHRYGLWNQLNDADKETVRITSPIGYLDFVSLMHTARFVVTDSGGVQEETTALGVSCFTFRDNTERPATCQIGTNLIVGTDPHKAATSIGRAIKHQRRIPKRPRNWDGHAAERIASIMEAQR